MFKLILGLSYKDVETSIKIAKTYAALGVDMIDCSAVILPYLQEALKNYKNIKYCVSVALFGDIHNKKAVINQKNCLQCFNCFKNCAQKAIKMTNEKIIIDKDKCVGCQNCYKNCKHNAIEIYEENLLEEDLGIIKKYKPDFLEVHLSVKRKKELLRGFKQILKSYKGNISICLSRKFLSTDKVVKTINELYEIFKKCNPNYKFLIQADGKSLNNASSDYVSNIETLAFYNELKDLGYNIIISGGLNDKTVELCKLFNLKPYGMAFGTYARKLALDEPDKAKKLAKEIKEFYEQN